MNRIGIAVRVMLTGKIPVTPAEPGPKSESDAFPADVPISSGEAASTLTAPLIELRDDVQSAAEDLDADGCQALRSVAARLASILALDDIVPIDDHGSFDPQRQTAVSGLVTTDPEQAQQIASTVRPGYERHGVLLRRQDVIVYRLSQEGSR